MQYMYLPSPRRLDVCFILRRCEEGRVAGGLGLDCRQGGKPHGKHIEFVDVVTFDVGTLGGSGGGLFVAVVSMLLVEEGNTIHQKFFHLLIADSMINFK